jgi:hypothetical protein
MGYGPERLLVCVKMILRDDIRSGYVGCTGPKVVGRQIRFLGGKRTRRRRILGEFVFTTTYPSHSIVIDKVDRQLQSGHMIPSNLPTVTCEDGMVWDTALVGSLPRSSSSNLAPSDNP